MPFLWSIRQSFYVRKRAYDKFGEQGLAPKKHGFSSEKPPLKTPPEIEEKIIYIHHFLCVHFTEKDQGIADLIAHLKTTFKG